MLSQSEVVIETLVERVASRAGGGGALGVDGAGARCIRADSDVSVHGAHVGIVQDEVGVIIVELTFILVSEEGKDEKRVN